MDAIDEKREALRLLDGLENGGMPANEAAILAEDLDPVLVFVIVNYLREIHPASDPAAGPVLERVVGMTSVSPAVILRHKEGEEDPVSRWFESEYSYADFRGRGNELVELIVDKIDS